MTYHAKVIAGGKIVMPADLRREYGIKDGATLIPDEDDSCGLSIMTFDQSVRESQRRRSAIAPASRSGSVTVFPCAPATGSWPQPIPRSASTCA